MTNILKTLTILMTLSCSIHAGILSSSKNNIDGQRYFTSISYEGLLKSTTWTPEVGEVPVSPTKALMLARESMNKEFPKFGTHTIRAISLGESYNGTWLYKVTLVKKYSEEEVKNAGGVLQPNMLTYFVLLNNKVISPKKSTK